MLDPELKHNPSLRSVVQYETTDSKQLDFPRKCSTRIGGTKDRAALASMTDAHHVQEITHRALQLRFTVLVSPHLFTTSTPTNKSHLVYDFLGDARRRSHRPQVGENILRDSPDFFNPTPSTKFVNFHIPPVTKPFQISCIASRKYPLFHPHLDWKRAHFPFFHNYKMHTFKGYCVNCPSITKN